MHTYVLCVCMHMYMCVHVYAHVCMCACMHLSVRETSFKANLLTQIPGVTDVRMVYR